MKKIFVDGSSGTTGLRIFERLAGRADLQLITLPEAQRKDSAARARAERRRCCRPLSAGCGCTGGCLSD